MASATSRLPLRQQLWSNRHASGSHQSLSQGNPSWPSEPFNEEQVNSCPVNDFPPKCSACLKSIEMGSQRGAATALAIQTLACFILINHVDMSNMQQQKFCRQGKTVRCNHLGFSNDTASMQLLGRKSVHGCKCTLRKSGGFQVPSLCFPP